MEQSKRYDIPIVQDFMTRKVITCTPEMDLSHVLKAFNKHRISALPVMSSDHSQEVAGFISEDDLMQAMASSSFFYAPSEPLTVAKSMVGDIQRLSPQMDLFEVTKLFHEKNLRHAPVIDERNHLVGIVSRRDVLRELEKIIEKQQGYMSSLKGPNKRSMTNEALWRLDSRG